ncbi:MAG TPA: hypothetical protein GX506_11155 [Firmicutes bacterium]|nr:hypothetical protein [Bacillota bacterium]
MGGMLGRDIIWGHSPGARARWTRAPWAFILTLVAVLAALTVGFSVWSPGAMAATSSSSGEPTSAKPPSAQPVEDGVSQGPFARVPASSWVYGAIAQFAKLGLVEGYNERSFSGGRIYTRYEFACIVSRLGEAIETRHPAPALNAKQRELLKRLKTEFMPEIAMVTSQEISLGEPAHTGNAAPDRKVEAKGIPVLDLSEHLTFPSRFALDLSAGVTLSDVLAGKNPKEGAAGDLLPSQAGGGSGSRNVDGSRAVTLLSQDRLKAELKIPVPTTPADEAGAAKGPAGGTPEARDGAKSSVNDEGQYDLIAAVGLEYALSKLASVTAGYELSQVPHSGEGETRTRGTATVGIDYSLLLGDSAFLRAGYSYSRSREQTVPGVTLGKGAGISLELDLPFLWQGLPQEGIQASGDSTSATTSLGIGYSLGRDTLLSLGYKLIDFTEAGGGDATHKRTNMATAELTIRF